MEGRHVFEHLTIAENLVAGAYTQKAGSSGDVLEEVYAFFPKLADMRNRVAGYLSGGEQQMLAIGRALMARPKLLMLDEPSLGLAPLLVQEIFGYIQRLNEERGLTVLDVRTDKEWTSRGETLKLRRAPPRSHLSFPGDPDVCSGIARKLPLTPGAKGSTC